MGEAVKKPNESKGVAGNVAAAIPVSYKPMTPDELAVWTRDAARKKYDVSADGHVWLGVSKTTQELLLLEPLYHEPRNVDQGKKLEEKIGPFQRRLMHKEELDSVYMPKQAINTAIQQSCLPPHIVQPLNNKPHLSSSTPRGIGSYSFVQRAGAAKGDGGYPVWHICQVRLALSLARDPH